MDKGHRRYMAKVEVTLRPLVHDPQGQLIGRTLARLGWSGVEELRVGKLFTFVLEAPDLQTAQEQAQELAQRVLANPQLERVHCEVAPCASG